MRLLRPCCAAILCLLACPVFAQPRSGDRTPIDAEAIKRGQALLVERCGFCHGSNARGGAGGSDLTRSEVVQEDERGKQLGEFLKVGRPERGMPPFELQDREVSDLAAFLHEQISLAANRSSYKILDIVVGDPKKGEAYFNRNCGSCHSATGDLKGVGSKYDPATLQGRVVMPRGGGRGGAGTPWLQPTAVKATVKLPSGEITAPLLRLTDFDVVVYDEKTQQPRSILRHDGVPEVVLTDPLQPHIDMWKKWTDDDMHDVTAYLVTLK